MCPCVKDRKRGDGEECFEVIFANIRRPAILCDVCSFDLCYDSVIYHEVAGPSSVFVL